MITTETVKLCFVRCLQYLDELSSMSVFYCMSTPQLLFTRVKMNHDHHRDCTRLTRIIVEKETLEAVARDLVALRIYGSNILL